MSSVAVRRRGSASNSVAASRTCMLCSSRRLASDRPSGLLSAGSEGALLLPFGPAVQQRLPICRACVWACVDANYKCFAFSRPLHPSGWFIHTLLLVCGAILRQAWARWRKTAPVPAANSRRASASPPAAGARPSLNARVCDMCLL